MPNSLDLPTIREIAAEVASEQNQRLEIVGVKTAGDGQYAEILVSVNGCEAEPCRVSLGVFRDAPPEDVRSAIADSLRQHLSARRLNV
jgi:hypothetical protein